MTETTTTLKPVNGLLRGDKCKRWLNDPDAYWGDRVDVAVLKGAKIGDNCPLCIALKGNQYYSSYAGCKAVIAKSTIIGPVHEVESSGNPLMDAAAILRVDGWVGGKWVCEEGKKCLAGAVRAACGILPEPDAEATEWAEKYTQRKWYRDGRKKAARALITLALEIHEAKYPRPKRENFTTDKWSIASEQYRHELEGWEAERHDIRSDIDVAIETVTNYNDSVLSRKAKRKGAIEILERAAAKFNPRMKLESYDH